jgi:hypothetical protein
MRIETRPDKVPQQDEQQETLKPPKASPTNRYWKRYSRIVDNGVKERIKLELTTTSFFLLHRFYGQ